MPGVDPVTALPARGEVLTPRVMPMLGSSMLMTGSGLGSSGSARVSPIMISGMPATAMMSPGPAPSGGASTRFEGFGHVELRQPDALHGAVMAAPGDLLAFADAPVADPAKRQPPDVRRGVEVGHQRLERVALLVGRAQGCARRAGRAGP